MTEQTSDTTIVRAGAALKGFRTERGWTLAEVSERTGLPISTLSKIENEKMELTIDKLLRISLALEINVADLFGTPSTQFLPGDGSKRRIISRTGEGKTVQSNSGAYEYQAYDLLNKGMTPIVASITARSMKEFGDFHRHEGEEYVYVLEGELALYTDTYTPAHLKVGDSIYFDSTMGHAYIAVGDQPCRILSVFSTTEEQTIDFVEDRGVLGDMVKKSRENDPG
ncbi:XRE family transcriptional regulator [Sphingomonas sp. UV9]|uniref:helix-turn-helix domain-containing protein n=1 Tax=Sphingomonas sp. UV9 TaxID=1851410 RepID=UPI000FFBB9DD|nr:XRE family transcriptional regulator [Sphingomonas sp. UV9]RXD04839.1 XRE family transcriptional regulator [Sphingomonas sp. UV9]